MEFEPQQSQEILGPLLAEQALADVPLFGPEKAKLKKAIELAISPTADTEQVITKPTHTDNALSLPFSQVSSVADKLTALRLASKNTIAQTPAATVHPSINLVSGAEPLSQLQRHESMLTQIKDISHLPSEGQAVLDHSMLFRAKEGYLFNYEANQRIVADDPWLRDVWAWVAGEFLAVFLV